MPVIENASMTVWRFLGREWFVPVIRNTLLCIRLNSHHLLSISFTWFDQRLGWLPHQNLRKSFLSILVKNDLFVYCWIPYETPTAQGHDFQQILHICKPSFSLHRILQLHCHCTIRCMLCPLLDTKNMIYHARHSWHIFNHLLFAPDSISFSYNGIFHLHEKEPTRPYTKRFFLMFASWWVCNQT